MVSTVLLAKVEFCLIFQVKFVFVHGLLTTWNEEQVKVHFSKFGEIERVVLASNMESAKRKDFGFVNYTTREAAIACIEAFSKDDELVDGPWFKGCIILHNQGWPKIHLSCFSNQSR